jgi:hypothetical protein
MQALSFEEPLFDQESSTIELEDEDDDSNIRVRNRDRSNSLRDEAATGLPGFTSYASRGRPRHASKESLDIVVDDNSPDEVDEYASSYSTTGLVSDERSRRKSSGASARRVARGSRSHHRNKSKQNHARFYFFQDNLAVLFVAISYCAPSLWTFGLKAR